MRTEQEGDIEDRDLQELLRTVGSRTMAPPELMEDVRRAVHNEWREMVGERTRRTRRVAVRSSIAASALIATAILVVKTPEPVPLAVLTRAEGRVMRDAGPLHADEVVNEQDVVKVGDELTSSQGRAAFATEEGLSFRMDAHTRLEIVGPNRVALKGGAIYVDADPAHRTAATFAVDTRHGLVRHVGTQYEVRDVRGAIHVSVREGRITIDKAGALHSGNAGERIVLADDGNVQRSKLEANDVAWEWIGAVAPVFQIENQPLIAFLRWFERESGARVGFRDTALEHKAGQIVLHGSIEGLAPSDALNAVLATTNLTSFEQEGRIWIDALR